MNLFRAGNFRLNSGATSTWKLECDALTDDDWRALAAMISQMVGPFRHCISVPRGRDRLRDALTPLATFGPILLVDDVLTTGRSIERTRDRWWERGDGRAMPGGFFRNMTVIGAVVFARGKCPKWVKALFQMPEELWVRQ